MTFAEKIRDLNVEKGSAALVWIGQAGFLLKTSAGKVILIDPCMTDYTYDSTKAEKGLGFYRLAPALFQPGELEVDILISSHEHEDHLEVPFMPAYLQYDKAEIWCNKPSCKLLEDAGIDMQRVRLLSKGDVIEIDDITLYVTDCDHGAETPFALGFVFDFGFTKVYYSGDTSFTPERLQQPVSMKPDIALLPINGEFGNLNSEEAAKLSALLHSKYFVPHHFFTFAMHGGDPRDALTAVPKFAPDCQLKFMTPGEIWILS